MYSILKVTMSTKVFLSWSGDLSRKAAEIFKNWLEIVIQELDVFYSENDIAKGTNGIKTIFDQLKDSVASVIMLTKANQTSPWICFEAGAMLSKQEGNACGLLLDFGIDDLEGPLQHLQQTRLEKEDVFKLLKTLNAKCGAPLTDEKLKRAFENNWDKLYNDLTPLISKKAQEACMPPTSAKISSKTTPKKSTETASPIVEENFYLRALKNHRDDIIKLLNAATLYNNKDYEWSIANMAKTMGMDISRIEVLTDIAMRHNLVTTRRDFGRKIGGVSVYKITPQATIMLENLKQD